MATGENEIDEATAPLLADGHVDRKDNVTKKDRIQPKRLVVVEPYVFLYLVASVPLESIFNQYFYRKVGYSMGIDVDNLTNPVNSSFGDCGTDPNDTNYLLREQVQAATSQWTLYISLAGFLPTVMASIVYGTMSDRIGRRMCFILPPIGTLVRAIFQACAIYFEWPVWVFFFNNIQYFFGSEELMIIGSFAYIADTTDQRHLAVRMTILDTLLLVTGGLANLGVGYMIRYMGYFWPMLLVIVAKLLALLYAIFLIPETVPNAGRAKRFDLSDFTRALKMLTHDDGTNRRWKINLLFSTFFLSSIFSILKFWPLVEMNAPLCWDSVLLGYYNAMAFFTQGIGALGGVFLKRCFAEEWIIVLSKLSAILEYTYVPFVRTTVMMFITPVIGVLERVALPMTRTVLSGYVGPDEQGALFAGMTTIHKMCSTTGQIITNNMYSATVLFLQGRAVFILAAIMIFFSTIVVLVFIANTKADRQRRLERENAPLTHGDGLVVSKRHRRRQLVTEKTALID